jgi:hypothetical protein
MKLINIKEIKINHREGGVSAISLIVVLLLAISLYLLLIGDSGCIFSK